MAGVFTLHLLLTGMATIQVGADETYSLETIYVTMVTLSTFHWLNRCFFYHFVVFVEEGMSIKLLLWYIRKMTWINAKMFSCGFKNTLPWFIVLHYYM